MHQYNNTQHYNKKSKTIRQNIECTSKQNLCDKQTVLFTITIITWFP